MRMLRRSILCLSFCSSAAAAAGEPVVITSRLHHLGTSPKPDWKEFTTVDPVHRNLMEFEFTARKEAQEYTLEIQAGDVDMDWRISLNEEGLGSLRRGPDLTTQYLRVPPTAVKNGANKLRVTGMTYRRGDDIYVGKALLHDRPLREVAGYARVKVRVRDADGGEGLPCRLTIVKPVEKKDSKGKVTPGEDLVEIIPVKETEKDLATRKGIIYTKKGLANFDIPAGKYTLYATRGFEYGLAVSRLELGRTEERGVDLELRREVDTTGLLAADTHIHTRTYSFHGDIELDERVIAIAGEGIELAIATDHNHHTDYQPTMKTAGMDEAFVPIIGNEVTTAWGHFNAFPVKKDERPADYDHSDWVNLVKAMRASSGVRVIIVNHPRRAGVETITPAVSAAPAGGPQGAAASSTASAGDTGGSNPTAAQTPAPIRETQSTFGRIGLNPLTGEAHRGPSNLGIDAVEVFNGKTLEDDGMLTMNDWFGMLNRGYHIAAVAGSDSHALNEIVGQARTYIASSTDDPRKISVDQLCDAFLQGRLLVSLGLLTQVEVDGKHGPGDLCTDLGPELAVKVTVKGPSWTRADSVALYLNGIETRREKIEPCEKPVKYEATWRIQRPAHDAHLVVVASGPPVTGLYWPISGGEKRYVMGATNAVWLDADGDGKFTSAYAYAASIADAHGFAGEGARTALHGHDAAVLAQFASLARAKVQADLQAAYDRVLSQADAGLSDLLKDDDPGVKAGFDRYLTASPKLDVSTRFEKDTKAARLQKEEADRKKRKEEEQKRPPFGRRPAG